VTWIGVAVNISLAALKLAIGYVARSQALLADGVHSLSDLVTDSAVLAGSHYWSAQPDKEHPYGHGRLETMVTIAIGMALAVTSVGIVWQALVTIPEAHSSAPGWMAFFAAAISILVKEILYRWTVRVGRRVKCRALTANAWHHRSDALSSIPVAAAVFGSHVFPQFVYLDHVAAVVVGLMLLMAAFGIVRPGFSELMEAQHDGGVPELVRLIQADYPDIHEIHKVRCRRVGGTIFVDLHMLVSAGMSVGASHAIAESLKHSLIERNTDIHDVTIHVEPSQAK